MPRLVDIGAMVPVEKTFSHEMYIHYAIIISPWKTEAITVTWVSETCQKGSYLYINILI